MTINLTESHCHLKEASRGGTSTRTSIAWLLSSVLFAAAALATACDASAEVPRGFVDELVLDGSQADLRGWYCLRFSPDGRMFVSEWRRGWIRVLTYDQPANNWRLLPQPFHRFTTPDSNADSDTARRGTLRSFAFDPDFESNGVIYATYMHDEDRRGYRIVRIRQSPENPHRSDGTEEILLTCPFFADGAQPDAHNGGGVVVGGDGKLYVGFGDGWREETATDLRGFAGKIVRLNRDGSIPEDNVWYDELEGDLRAIVGVGQRNPTCLSRHPVSGGVYINGFTGVNKASMFRQTQGAHYGHGGSCRLGEPVREWVNTRLESKHKGGTTWACWYPQRGGWPEEYWLNAFAVNWMTKSGEIVRIQGGDDQPKTIRFASHLFYRGGDGIEIAPVAAEIGPDGQLYYTMREYGEYSDLRRIRYTGDQDGRTSATAETNAPYVSSEMPSSAKIGIVQERAHEALHGGDAARGRQIFFENDGLACLKCHQFGKLGGAVGPPLTEIGSQRKREHLLESILLPDKSIEDAYIQQMVVTEGGKVITGRVEKETEDHVSLITAEGDRVELPADAISARQRAKSAMPDDIGQRLTMTQLRDLVEFLATARSSD